MVDRKRSVENLVLLTARRNAMQQASLRSSFYSTSGTDACPGEGWGMAKLQKPNLSTWADSSAPRHETTLHVGCEVLIRSLNVFERPQRLLVHSGAL